MYSRHVFLVFCILSFGTGYVRCMDNAISLKTVKPNETVLNVAFP